MSKQSLIEALRNARASSPALESHDQFINSWSNIKTEQIKPFIDALEAEPELNQIWGKWASLTIFGTAIYPESAAKHLTDRARRGIDPDNIITSLLNFGKTGEVNVASVSALSNIKVREKVEIAAGVYVASPDLLPKNQCWRSAFVTGLVIGSRIPPAILPGTAALVVEKRIKAAFYPHPAPREGPNAIPVKEPVYDDVQKDMEKARIALIVAGGTAPTFGISYAFVSDEGWPGQQDNGGGGTGSRYPRSISLDSEASADMNTVFSATFDVDLTMEGAMSRLHASRTRSNEVERAIDLGTCLEMLLMHEGKAKGKTDNTEITNKISHRGAWLMGSTFEEREEIFKSIKSFYGLRSTAVHSGLLPRVTSAEKGAGQAKQLAEMDRLCGRLLVRLLQGWPEWNDLTLGKPV